jgi:hypothetical protein
VGLTTFLSRTEEAFVFWAVQPVPRVEVAFILFFFIGLGQEIAVLLPHALTTSDLWVGASSLLKQVFAHISHPFADRPMYLMEGI